MSDQNNGEHHVKLYPVDQLTGAGNFYPKEVMQAAIDKLKADPTRQVLYGEIEQVSFEKIHDRIRAELPEGEKHLARERTYAELRKRLAQIQMNNVSHVIDASTLQIKGNFVMASIKPSGPHADAMAKLLDAPFCSFGMRGYVTYENGGTTQPHLGQKVTSLEIITFDHIAPSHAHP